MKRFTTITWFLMAFILLALAACGGGASASPTADANMVYTQIWQTVVAGQTQTALVIPTATNTPAASLTAEASNTPLLTDTPLPGTPSVTPHAANTRAATSQISCDNAQDITDVNYPDNTVVPAGTAFTKTWSFKNSGPCTWHANYVLIFSYSNEGAGWDGTSPVHFSGNTVPGNTINISVNLSAPAKAGTYRGVFRLQNDKGFNFGAEFWVQIVVK